MRIIRKKPLNLDLCKKMPIKLCLSTCAYFIRLVYLTSHSPFKKQQTPIVVDQKNSSNVDERS